MMNIRCRRAAPLAAALFLLAAGAAWSAGRAELLKHVDKDASYLRRLYEHLHSHPELSLNEVDTAKRIAEELRRAGYSVTEGVGGRGVVGLLKNGDGPTVLIRADMDALPVAEKTGAPYASKVTTKDHKGNKVSVMHACGHDVHMASLVGAARALAASRAAWSGTLVLVGQPAEERGKGALKMLQDGLYTRFPRPDYALALHAASAMTVGKAGYTAGFYNAGIDAADITVRGVGGHGAYPHTTKDPIVLAAQIVNALQTIVSRELKPTDDAVVTVGTIHGGTKRNIIPEEVKLELTIRWREEPVREKILRAIRRLAENTARAAGFPEDRLPVVKFYEPYLPPGYNDPALTARLLPVLREVFGPDNVAGNLPGMGGDDFARYGRVEPPVPSFMFRLGVVTPAAMRESPDGPPGLHSPTFLPDPERAPPAGAKALAATAFELLRPE
ncbi:MAG: amidohydrolase [Elusimicrobiota bacterium]